MCYLSSLERLNEDSANIPDLDVLAREIMEELKVALEQFS